MQPVGLGQGLQDPCPAAPSCRCLRGLRPGLFKATLGKGLLGAGGGSWGLSDASSSHPGGYALVSAMPRATHAASEHLQPEHQWLPWDLRVWAGQYQLFLIGAEGAAAAALAAHLIGVHVEAGKDPPQGAWVRAMALGSPTPPQPLGRRTDPGGVLRVWPLSPTFLAVRQATAGLATE